MTSKDIYLDLSTDFVSKAVEVHGNNYDYSKVEYMGYDKPVNIVCTIHGDFVQTPTKHLRGRGCRKCSFDKNRLNTEKFIEKARAIHNEKYDYSQVDYKHTKTKVKIICKKHGIFEQTPNSHISAKQNCPKCTCSNRESKISSEWILSLNNPLLIKEYRLPENKHIVVDAFDIENNIIYQFHGDYWHGNPVKYNHKMINCHSNKSFDELYLKTKEIENKIKSYGYKLVVIWESEFIASKR